MEVRFAWLLLHFVEMDTPSVDSYGRTGLHTSGLDAVPSDALSQTEAGRLCTPAALYLGAAHVHQPV